MAGRSGSGGSGSGSSSGGSAAKPPHRPGGVVRPSPITPGDRRTQSSSAAQRATAQRTNSQATRTRQGGTRAPRDGRTTTGQIPHSRVPHRVRRRLATGERLEVAQHEHSIVLVVPVVIVVVSLIVVYILANLTGYAPIVVSVLGLAWLGVVLWAGYRFWAHSVQWLIITNKRVMRIDGLFERVAMLPLPRLTDIAFERTVLGQLFGYGKFTLESAGQIQALREINFVTRPNLTHTKLTELLYKSQEDENPGDGA